MDRGRDIKIMNAGYDRLSNLPDDLIHKILSFVSIKQAIRACILSSRWRFIWTSMPHLNFSTEDFSRLFKFFNFVTHVLSLRNNQTPVSSVKLVIHEKISAGFVQRVVDYAFSHNVEQLEITCILGGRIQHSLSLLSARSLKHLTLSGANYNYPIILRSTWELPALTTLHLDCITFHDYNSDSCVSLLTKCTSLKNLTLNHCNIKGSDGFSICSPRLSDLTLQNGDWGSKVINVVAPQLKNLTIIDCIGKYILSAPNLASLLFKGYSPLLFSSDNFRFLEKVYLCIGSPSNTGASKIVGLLQNFHNVKYLTVNVEIIQLLSYVDPISIQRSPFSNLKSLKILQAGIECEHKHVAMSTEVKSFFQHSS